MAIPRLGRFVTHWLPLLLWAGLIAALSSRPVMPNVGPKLSETEYLFDDVAHAGEFGLLCWLAWRAFGVSGLAWPSHSPALSAWGFAALYAALDEAHQAFVPGRMATLPDWLADVAGATLVAIALSVWARRRGRSRGT